jgi:peptidase E
MTTFNPPKPIYLFADSHLLFWKDGGHLFLDSIKEELGHDSPKAAYVGASNGDEPAFYGIFEAAMEIIGIKDCRMIKSAPSEDDLTFVKHADLILLAGGDVEKGWRVFEQNGLARNISNREAVLIGVSAGAVQLGLYGWHKRDDSHSGLIDTFKLVPFIVGVHEEDADWEGLSSALCHARHDVEGLGIPAGGGVIYRADYSLEPVRKPAHFFRKVGDEIAHSIFSPGPGGEVQEASGRVC